MQIKVSYTKGDTTIRKVIVEGANLPAALKAGYKQYGWESVLEVTTPDNLTLKGRV